jgi:hypothetical protein
MQRTCTRSLAISTASAAVSPLPLTLCSVIAPYTSSAWEVHHRARPRLPTYHSEWRDYSKPARTQQPRTQPQAIRARRRRRVTRCGASSSAPHSLTGTPCAMSGAVSLRAALSGSPPCHKLSVRTRQQLTSCSAAASTSTCAAPSSFSHISGSEGLRMSRSFRVF